jgi:hypothetical protein
LGQQLAAALAQCQALKADLDTRTEEATDLSQQVAALTGEVEVLSKEHDRLSQNLAVQDSVGRGNDDKSDKIKAERDELKARLAAAEKKLASQESGDGQKKDDVQRRYEMAVEDLRELKKENAELEAKLRSRGSDGGGRAASSGGGHMDWESQKQRLLASLEADFDEDDEDDSNDKVTIEETIRITDQVVAEKDREIEDLKQLLQQQSSNVGSLAVGAAAVAEILDHDELIQQEREKLRLLEAECRQTLRSAEIDISVERARLARERAELEEKLQTLQGEQAQSHPPEAPAADGSKPGKPGRGRWLTRLGLKDLDE